MAVGFIFGTAKFAIGAAKCAIGAASLHLAQLVYHCAARTPMVQLVYNWCSQCTIGIASKEFMQLVCY